MKIQASVIGFTLALSIAFAPASVALTASQTKTCNALGAKLQKQQAKAQKLAAERLDLLEKVEDAGDDWENAETLRNFGEAEANAADSHKAKYDSLKADLLSRESALQELISSVNSDVADYNNKCAKK